MFGSIDLNFRKYGASAQHSSLSFVGVLRACPGISNYLPRQDPPATLHTAIMSTLGLSTLESSGLIRQLMMHNAQQALNAGITLGRSIGPGSE